MTVTDVNVRTTAPIAPTRTAHRAGPPVSGWATWTPKTVAAMVALCAVATGLRSFTFRGLWVDEAIEVAQARMPFGQMITKIAAGDLHPPLHHSLVWVSIRMFGDSEFSVRLPSLIAGVALVPVLFWVGHICYDHRTGWVAAILGAVAPFAVWYSQEARMYSLFMVLSVAAVGAQVQAVRRGRPRDWVLYGLVTALLCWTQYFAVLSVLVQQLAFGWLFWRSRGDRPRLRSLLRGWLLATGIIAVALLPLLPIALQQLGKVARVVVPGSAGVNNSNVEDPLSIYSVGANLIWAIFGYHSDPTMVLIAALWPFAMLLAFLLLGRGRSGPSVLLLLLIVVPLAALLLVGSTKRDLFELRYFSGAVPAILLLMARLITAATVRRTATVLAASVVTVVLTGMLVDQQFNGTNPRRYEFEGAFSIIADRLEPGDVVLYAPDYLATVFDYYAPEFDAQVIGGSIPANHRVFVVATDLVVDSPSMSAGLGNQLARIATNHAQVDLFKMPNVQVWEFDPK